MNKKALSTPRTSLPTIKLPRHFINNSESTWNLVPRSHRQEKSNFSSRTSSPVAPHHFWVDSLAFATVKNGLRKEAKCSGLCTTNHTQFIGMFDGISGHECSAFLKHQLFEFISRQRCFPQYPHEAISRGFLEADSAFLSQYSERSSGARAIALVLIENVCFVAHTGDCKIVLVQNSGKTIVDLTRRSKDTERELPKAYRTFGFAEYKAHCEDGMARPYITCFRVCKDTDFVVAVNSPDVFSSRELVWLVRNSLSNRISRNIDLETKRTAKLLVETAKLRHATRAPAAMLVCFPGINTEFFRRGDEV